MYRTVEFQHSFSNDWQFDAHKNPIAPGARELADVIVRELGKRVNVITPVQLYSYYGRAFEVTFEGCRFVNVLNPADKVCYLTVQLCQYWLRACLFQRPRQKFEQYCEILEQAIVAVPEVSGVFWQKQKC